MSRTINQQASAIQDATDRCLAEAYEARDQIEGSINWADLKCVDVESRVSLLGTAPAAIYALVEEASPGADKLCRWVEQRLKEKGFPGVSVETAW